MSINDFVKAIKEWDKDAEFWAYSEKDGLTFKSKGWKVEYFDGNKTEINPHVAPKMLDLRTGKKKK